MWWDIAAMATGFAGVAIGAVLVTAWGRLARFAPAPDHRPRRALVLGCHPEPEAALMAPPIPPPFQTGEYSQDSDEGLTRPELSAYLRRLAGLELVEHDNIGEFRRFRKRAFLNGRASALFAVAELVERGEIRAGLLSEPICRLHRPQPPTSPAMPED